MQFLKEFGKLFETPDERTVNAATKALSSLEISEQASTVCQKLSNDDFHFLKELGGENGSAVALHGQELDAVMKTYEPTGDPISGEIIENADRNEQLLEELAAFLVAELLPVVHVPPTVLRKLTPALRKEWNLSPTYHSEESVPAEQAVMLQEFVPDAIIFNRVGKTLPELADPHTVFGLLLFDYLIAYGDGRMGNLLVASKEFWPIDHSKSFRLQGSVRGIETLGISSTYALENTAKLLSLLDVEKAKKLVVALEMLLGKKKALAFAHRFAKVHHVLSKDAKLTVSELKNLIESTTPDE